MVGVVWGGLRLCKGKNAHGGSVVTFVLGSGVALYC